MQELFKKYPKEQVTQFINYVNNLKTEKDRDGKLKNARATYITDNKYVEFFEKVASEGLVLDGVHITIQSRWISYDYIALKNKMLLVYPDTIFDVQLVKEWDEIEFRKDSGKIWYSHKIANPFATSTGKVKWAYAIVKNERGEFLTTLNEADLQKHRKTAKTDYIRQQWYDEMCLKTVMKKACKLHFSDVFAKIEEQDNENYSVDNPLDIMIEHKSAIDAINTIEELKEYYEKNKGIWKSFDEYVLIRKKQIQW